MKRKVFGFWFLVFGLVIFLSLLQRGCYAQQIENITPKDEFEKPDPYTWDFGQVKQGEILEHGFILKNESGRTLKIKDIQSSCGCTVPKIEKKVLLPGETTLIEVKFNSNGYSGLVQQFVYLHTDSIDNPILRFIIKAEVVK